MQSVVDLRSQRRTLGLKRCGWDWKVCGCTGQVRSPVTVDPAGQRGFGLSRLGPARGEGSKALGVHGYRLWWQDLESGVSDLAGTLCHMNQQDCLPRVELLVTDLDNTLFDWFAMWYPSFNAMLEAVTSKSGLSRESLFKEIRAVHQHRRTSEYSYLLNELQSLKDLHPGENISEVYKDAIISYRSMRRKTMRLYPGVRDALIRIKQFGVPIAVYTESLGYYSAWRLRELHLDGVIDYLYSPPDHSFPEGVTPDMLRSRPPESYDLKETEHRYTPKGILKPNVKILRRILRETGVSASRAVYVGDSLMKDIAMAKDVGMFDVFAEYGLVQDHKAYSLLQQVSHWDERDVERERRINERPNVTPSYVLHKRFDEIFQFFKFGDQA